MKNMRHRVNVMRPTKAGGEYGEPQGEDLLIIKDWRCSIETLSGREAETAHQNMPSATYKVSCYGDPKKPLKAGDYCDFQGRKLHIGFVKDKNQNGIELELLCGEEVA